MSRLLSSQRTTSSLLLPSPCRRRCAERDDRWTIYCHPI